jgi:hypothetical protein
MEPYRILLMLRYTNALDEHRALSIKEIAGYLKLDCNVVKVVVERLYEEEMIFFDGERVWLSPKGFLSALKSYS